MTPRASISPRLVCALSLVILAVGCGPNVIVADSPETESVGGGGFGTTSSSSGTPTNTECADSCSILPANQTCTCARTCSGDFIGKAACAPVVDLQGNAKIECVCTVGDNFSGVCFEKNEAALCDFEDGCCAKYFSGK